MRVLVVLQHANFFRSLEGVLRALHERRHHVSVIHSTEAEAIKAAKKIQRLSQKAGPSRNYARGLEMFQTEVPELPLGLRIEPTERWQQILRDWRQVINQSIYFRPDHPSPHRVVDLFERNMPERLQRLAKNRIFRSLVSRPAALSLWRSIELLSRPSNSVVAQLRELRPDVMLVSPTIWPKSPIETDYLRAARALGIPTIGSVNSWDNLTSKGTVHIVPDVFLVWNEPIAREAFELHSVPRRRIRIVGAPHFDHVFSMRRGRSREEVCAAMGCRTDRPMLLYLCTSRTLIEDEIPIVRRIVDAFEQRFPQNVPLVVVRPHPTHTAPWAAFEDPRIIVFPRGGDMADNPAAWQEYYDQLISADAVFGLNTTAFLEAAVADRPCMTIVAPEFHASQGKTGHFRHLLDGNFLDVANDFSGVAEIFARLLAGNDQKARARKEFVHSFIRPCGLQTDASAIVANVIENIGLQKTLPVRARSNGRVNPLLGRELTS